MSDCFGRPTRSIHEVVDSLVRAAMPLPMTRLGVERHLVMCEYLLGAGRECLGVI